MPLDAHGNPIVIEDETSDALGLAMGRGSIGAYDDGVGGLSMGGDEERVPLARTMDLEAVSFCSVLFAFSEDRPNSLLPYAGCCNAQSQWESSLLSAVLGNACL